MDDQLGLSAESKNAVVVELKKVLASTFSLYFKAHTFHWNVTGKHFGSLHSFFEGQYEALWSSIDEIAERIRIMGEKAPMNLSEMLQGSVVPECTSLPNPERMISDLFEGHSAIVNLLRNAIFVAEKVGDVGTAGFLAGRIEYHEKTVWMLRSHLEI
jgi:starvation-inducible DNA-binding protein